MIQVANQIETKQNLSTERLMGELVTYQPRVLIIDDDVDAAILVHSLFREFGVHVNVQCEPKVAKRLLCATEWDLVILDWYLDTNFTASKVLKDSESMIQRFRDLRSQFSQHPRSVITYSVLPESDIQVPETPYFDHINHWQKPMSYLDLRDNIETLLPLLISHQQGGQ